MIICAGEIESFDFATPIGIGLIQSAIRLTKICMEKNPKELLFIGSAGSYGECEIGKIYQSDVSSNVEIGYFNNLSYTPLKDKNVSRETLKTLVVNSSNFITCNTLTCKQFLENGFDLENMEFFAVQSVAKNFGIKSSGIFYITNYCNESAHEDFIKNHKKAIEKLTLHVREII